MAWKKIKQCKNYSVNTVGDVRNDKTGMLKRPYKDSKNGYLYVDLWENNKPKKIAVHRLLAEAFLPNVENKPCVYHKDGNRCNNSIDNLRWATYSENNSRFWANRVASRAIFVTHYEEQRNKRSGKHIAWGNVLSKTRYDKIKDAGKAFGVADSNISQMLKSGTIGRRGKMRGFKFEYAER